METNLFKEGYLMGLINMEKRKQGKDFDVFECPNWDKTEWVEGYQSGIEDYLKVFGIWEARIKHA